jgi:hypothetical protein
VAAKALLARYPLENVLQELRGVVEEARTEQPTFLEQVGGQPPDHLHNLDLVLFISLSSWRLHVSFDL